MGGREGERAEGSEVSEVRREREGSGVWAGGSAIGSGRSEQEEGAADNDNDDEAKGGVVGACGTVHGRHLVSCMVNKYAARAGEHVRSTQLTGIKPNHGVILLLRVLLRRIMVFVASRIDGRHSYSRRHGALGRERDWGPANTNVA